MKLILVNRYFFPDESATSRMLTSLARSLVANGWSVDVLTSRSLHNDPTKRLGKRQNIGGVKVRRLGTTAFGRDWLPGRMIDYLTFHILTIFHLLGKARPSDICVICTDPPLLSVTATLPIRLRRAVSVNWLLDLFPEVAIHLGVGANTRKSARLALWLRDWSLQAAAANVTPIARMSAYLRHRKVPDQKLVTISHWSDDHSMQPLCTKERNSLRVEWGLTNRFVVAYSGNFGRAHDFGTFLDAAQRLQHRDNIVFVFIGDGYHKEKIDAAMKEKKLRNVVLKPLQPRERLTEALNLADVHLVSLLPDMEPFIVPSKLYGILAAGRPTVFVGDPAGEIATVLATSECGKAVVLGDGEGLARIVVELSENAGLRSRLGRNARTAFESHYTEQRGAADWQHLLTRILSPEHIARSGARSRKTATSANNN